MPIGSRICPDCQRRVRQPFRTTVTGRLVCPDCADAVTTAAMVGAIDGNPGVAVSVWAMIQRRIRRTR